MKLLSTPGTTIEYVDVMLSSGACRIPGRSSQNNVEIFCPDAVHTDISKDEVWRTLQYGIAQKFELGIKIPLVAFREINKDTVLYGVVPINETRHDTLAGNIFECQIDYYEVKENGPQTN